MNSEFLSLIDFCSHYDLKIGSVRSGLKRQPKNWPPYMKIGNLIRFKKEDINIWEENIKQKA